MTKFFEDGLFYSFISPVVEDPKTACDPPKSPRTLGPQKTGGRGRDKKNVPTIFVMTSSTFVQFFRFELQKSA